VIEKWLKLLAGFIVDALCDRLGITSVDDLIGKASTAFKQELTDELSKLDDIPAQIIAGVVPQLMNPIQQMVTQVAAIPGQVMGSIQNLLNPFK
jgi:hypothetical protein